MDYQQYKERKIDHIERRDIIKCRQNIIRNHSTSVSMSESNLIPSQSMELSLTLNQTHDID